MVREPLRYVSTQPTTDMTSNPFDLATHVNRRTFLGRAGLGVGAAALGGLLRPDLLLADGGPPRRAAADDRAASDGVARRPPPAAPAGAGQARHPPVHGRRAVALGDASTASRS